MAVAALLLNAEDAEVLAKGTEEEHSVRNFCEGLCDLCAKILS